MRKLISLALPLLLGAACQEDDDSGSPDGSGTGTGSSSGDGGSNEEACEEEGGVCGCAGGCEEGYEPAPPPLLYGCPQPPPNSGACSMQCCLPIDPGTGDTSTSSTSSTGTTSGSGSASCEPQDCYNDGGPCDPNPLELWKWTGSDCEIILVGCGTNTGEDCDELYNDQNVCLSEHDHCG